MANSPTGEQSFLFHTSVGLSLFSSRALVVKLVEPDGPAFPSLWELEYYFTSCFLYSTLLLVYQIPPLHGYSYRSGALERPFFFIDPSSDRFVCVLSLCSHAVSRWNASGGVVFFFHFLFSCRVKRSPRYKPAWTPVSVAVGGTRSSCAIYW